MNIRFIQFSVVALAASSLAFADEGTNLCTVSTVSGVTYSNVAVHRVEPDGMTIMTGKGVTKIPFSDLPLEWQQKYNYDPAAAAIFMQQQEDVRLAIARKQQAVDMAVNNRIQNAVVWIAVILDDASAFATIEYPEEAEVPSRKWVSVPDRTKPKKPGFAQPTKQEWVNTTKTIMRTQRTVALVVGIPKNIGEREKFKATLYRAGRHIVADNAVEGRASNVRKGDVIPRFATSAELARKLLSENQ